VCTRSLHGPKRRRPFHPDRDYVLTDDVGVHDCVGLRVDAVHLNERGLPVDEERWPAYLTDDEPPELAFYCPECAERVRRRLSTRGAEADLKGERSLAEDPGSCRQTPRTPEASVGTPPGLAAESV
jgi:hypothetical protein